MGEEISQLPCNHIFKKDAITEWLREAQAKCPVCRFELKSTEVKIEPSIVQQQQQQQQQQPKQQQQQQVQQVQPNQTQSVQQSVQQQSSLSENFKILICRSPSAERTDLYLFF